MQTTSTASTAAKMMDRLTRVAGIADADVEGMKVTGVSMFSVEDIYSARQARVIEQSSPDCASIAVSVALIFTLIVASTGSIETQSCEMYFVGHVFERQTCQPDWLINVADRLAETCYD
ncbi:unnamed protein product [Mycena citricolor]|uniref:Uncharacterized protein n=1 Tax=Mycena citricolor TaxID=2018698 RepID=A0AAD2HAD7_9AGAR|nr:unnamed protein product [Mycena citricolor]CAK5273014.1 unnamed protein product [Mycena citricolor]